MPLHDTSYQHWDGVHLGLWRRRGGLAMIALLFFVGQLLFRA
jgi:hypothetical protein